MNEYIFYKFIQNYHERDGVNNETAPRPETRDDIIGVLDGQQRLSSMYLALQGSYAEKLRYKRWNDNEAFPKKQLYLNLLYTPAIDDNEDFLYNFSFLTNSEAKFISDSQLWFKINEVLKWGDDPEIDAYFDNMIEIQEEQIKVVIKDRAKDIKKTLRILHQRIAIEKIINFFTVKGNELDEILNIFVRVNSGGTQLSKTDLLFSTIVATWQDARDEVEVLLKSINDKGQGFGFDTDFIMRSCLCLCDLPVVFKVKQFKADNVIRIQNQWEDIRSSIIQAIDLIVEFGFSKENLTSTNAVIPISYYIIKGGVFNDNTKKELNKYLIHTSIKKTFGAQTDRVLSTIRDAIRINKNGCYTLKETKFNFIAFGTSTNLPPGRELICSNDDLDDILQLKKGPYSFAILSLLYPNINYSQVTFHQDHIHPYSSFSKSKLNKLKLSDTEIEKWLQLRDQLPNLQLLEGNENKKKSKRPFKDWLLDQYPSENDQNRYLANNYISPTQSLEFTDFLDFFEKRRNELKANILKALL